MVYPSINYVLPNVNTGCFIQYHSEDATDDLPPNQWYGQSMMLMIILYGQ